jgi:glutamyl-tRNA reductase
LYQQNALVIGVGDAGRLAGRALADAGVRNIAVTNRTYSRAVDLAGDLGGAAVSFDELPQHLNHADVVITSTASPGYVLDRDAVNEAISSRNGRPLLLIDIAVPRDIDPLVGELGNVWLYDIDALQLMTEPATEVMEREIARAELIADEETDRFLEWWDSLGAVPLVTAIRGKAEDIRRAEVAKYLKKLRGQWPPDTAQVLEAMTISLVKKLLHSPTAYLRGGQDPELQQLAWKLFNIGGGERRGRK